MTLELASSISKVQGLCKFMIDALGGTMSLPYNLIVSLLFISLDHYHFHLVLDKLEPSFVMLTIKSSDFALCLKFHLQLELLMNHILS